MTLSSGDFGKWEVEVESGEEFASLVGGAGLVLTLSKWLSSTLPHCTSSRENSKGSKCVGHSSVVLAASLRILRVASSKPKTTISSPCFQRKKKCGLQRPEPQPLAVRLRSAFMGRSSHRILGCWDVPSFVQLTGVFRPLKTGHPKRPSACSFLCRGSWDIRSLVFGRRFWGIQSSGLC